MSVETQDTSRPNGRTQAFSALLREAMSRGWQLSSSTVPLDGPWRSPVWELVQACLPWLLSTGGAEKCISDHPAVESAALQALRANEKNRERLGSKDGLGSPLLPGRRLLPGKWGWQMPQSHAPSSPPNLICSLGQCCSEELQSQQTLREHLLRTRHQPYGTVSVLLGLPGQKATQQDPSGDSQASAHAETMLFPVPRPRSREKEVRLGADNSFQN